MALSHLLALPRWCTSYGLPIRAFWDCPISVALPCPIRVLNYLFHSVHEGIDGTHAIRLLRASLDASQRYNTIVDDYADLWARKGCAFQD